ncbi:hNH endonuclease [Serratia marcescens]|uniref:hypothetical protein n=1 Tax=Serratia TaxID=613 RepID=UPI0007454935|nr:hypothetical protein [Serratia marcescens]EME1468110.1 hNH endonuclease [Serratia marcescens]MBN3904715.1 hNH endonuclease [Serratia marcescens]MBN3916217.1 hNH endonuclease [Serratia marcescens]MBN3921245.1 hNH endonuclease [Serratia marcescens]MBN3937824.1 hNH endonuclease [Serratia marcescens]
MKNIVENQGIKTDKPLPMSYEALKAERDALAQRVEMLAQNLGNAIWGEQEALQRVNALAVENAALKDVLESICCRENEPEYHDCGMGCGLEDRGITDRYAAMAHGWESAMERVYEEVIPFIEDLPETPATDAALAAIQAQGVEKFADDLHKVAMSLCAVKPDNTTPGAYAGMARSFAKKLREAK